MSEKKVGKRLLTWVLVLVMTLSLLPLNVLAAEADEAAALQMSDEDNSDDRSLMPTKDTTYTITFDANGGTFADGTEQYVGEYSSEDATVWSQSPKDNPTRPPYVFEGWYKKFGTIKTDVDIKNDKVKNVLIWPSTSRTLYAKWSLPANLEVASIFYLKDPTCDHDSNTGADWCDPLGGTTAGFVDTTGFIWKQSATNASVENSMSVQPDDVTWPTGFGTPSTDGLELDKSTTVWNDIFEAFKTKVEADNGGISLTKDEVDSITLVPYKVSRGNQTHGNYHVDCDVVINCNFVTVDFKLENDSGAFASILPNGKMTWLKNTAFPENNAPAVSEREGYEFGWYTDEDCTKKADFDKPLTTDTTFYGKYTEKETPAPEPADPELGVNFIFSEKTMVVKFICETTVDHNDSYGLKNGYYSVSNKKKSDSGKWRCAIEIDLNKYFADFYSKDHPGHTRTNPKGEISRVVYYLDWNENLQRWTASESLISATEIHVKCNEVTPPTEPTPVTLTANSKTVKYDGQPHDGLPYSCDALGLLPGHTVEVESVDYTCEPQTNVGEYDIELDNAKIVDADGNDVTDLYQITYNYGTLIIEPCDVTVTIKGNTGTYEYDGTEKTVEGYTANINNDLYTEADFKLVDSQAKIRATVPGTYPMGLKPENFENTNPNFNVTFVVKPDGKLTIENRPITITANDVTGKYDGQPHGENGYSITAGSLVDGHAATVTISGSKTDAGEYEELLVPNVTKIVDAKNKDVTGYYDISYEDGSLTINKRSVTLTSETASKVYDGTPLTKPEVTVTGDGFVEGEGATYDVTGTITNVGETENKFTYTLNEGTKAGNYDITKTEGTLEVTPVTDKVTVTIKGNTDSVRYNGKEHKVEGYQVENISNNLYTKADFALKDGSKAEAKGTRVGTYPMGLTAADFTNNSKNFTNVEFVVTDGKLTITRRPSNPQPPTEPKVDIPDDDALGLNTTDHFAYIVGYGNGEVRPQNNITRAEVATIFFRLLTDDVRDENLTKTNRYSDVTRADWYNTAVSTLSSMGIITGYPDGTFRPNAAITRAEFAAIAARFDTNGDKTTAKFSDIATHWAKDEISIAYNNGWITGYPNGTFGPQRDITRAETMTLVNRVLNRQPETEDDLLPNMTVWTDNANPKAWYYLAVQEATNSHYYKFKTNSKYEKWTELRETRDWTQLEK